MNKTRLHKILRRVVIIAIVFVLVFSLSSVIFSAVFFHFMFARRDSVREYVRIDYSLIDTGQYTRRAVSFLSGENTLKGYLYGEQNKNGLIIIAPGISSDADAHLAEIMSFVDSGYTVLAYDATGTFESEGESRIGLQQSKRDLLAAIDFAADDSVTRDMPVFLYGHSLGAYAAAAALEQTDVEAAICLSGFDSPVGTMYGTAKGYVGFLADIEYPFLYLQNFIVFGGDADTRAVDGVNSGDTPVLICYGSGDKVIPYELSMYSHESELRNPNAHCELIEDEYRNGHSYMWLSHDAARYVAELQDELDDLSQACGGEVPDSVLEDFYSGVDAERATKTDGEFIGEVCDFFEQAVR